MENLPLRSPSGPDTKQTKHTSGFDGDGLDGFLNSMGGFLVLVIGGRDYMGPPNEGNMYAGFFSGISKNRDTRVLQNGW